MDGIRPPGTSWIDSPLPKVKRFPPPPNHAIRDEVSPYLGAADKFRDLARQRLGASNPQPSETLVELTALQLAEQKYLEQGGANPAPAAAAGQPLRGLLSSATYMGALAAAQLSCHPALTPTLLAVLGDLDPQKILGASHENGGNKWIIAGASLTNQIQASQAAGAQGQVLGIPLTGVIDPAEQGRIQTALQPLMDQIGPERLRGMLKNLHIQTLLGELLNPTGPKGMAGLGGGGQVALSRDSLLTPDKLKDYLAHEVGHLVDEDLGKRYGLSRLSDDARLPFGKGGHRNDFRSEYSALNASEDFAETHADLMLNWHQYKQFPELGMLARGSYGEKLAYIAQVAYNWPIPALRPELQKMVQDVRAGQSPLGFFNDKGEVVEAERHLQRILKAVIDHTNPEGKIDEVKFFQVNGPEKLRREWVLKTVRGESTEPVKAVSVNGLTRDLIEVINRPPGDPEKTRCGSTVLHRLEVGGPHFFESCKSYFAQHYSPQQVTTLEQQLTRFVLVAGPNWQAGTI